MDFDAIVATVPLTKIEGENFFKFVTLRQNRFEYVSHVLKTCKGNKTAASIVLGIGRKRLLDILNGKS